MKIFLRISGIALVILLIIIIVTYFLAEHISKESIPDYNQTVLIHGLHKQVKVFRDSFAIPHIYAENEEDLYRVSGYLMAQDRLWQMDILRRASTGRLSEVLGKKTLKSDILMRCLRINEKSALIISRSDKKVLRAMEAYADGINQFIRQNINSLPLEFKILHYKPAQWSIADSYNLLGFMAWDLNGSWNSEILLHKLISRLGKERASDFIPRNDSLQPYIYGKLDSCTEQLDWRNELMSISSTMQDLGLQVFHGSNNWVISGSRTASGKPILANDMHLAFSVPGIWYQMHQVIPGKLDVTGVVLPGEPFVVSGHNSQIAWGLTNVMNDDIDFYKETLNGSDSTKYKLDGKWKDLLLKKESIAVKGGDTVRVTLRFTHRGPIISMLKDLPDEVISMRWMGNEYSNEVQSLYLLNKASNWTDFCEAMKTFISVSQNAVYADTAGNIGMYCCAGIPIRTGNPLLVQKGDTSAFDWKGFVPFDSLPHEYNPPKGYAISANNHTIDKLFPHYISAWFDLPYRYKRIDALLRQPVKFTPALMTSVQTDNISVLAQEYIPTLIDIIKGENTPSVNEKLALNMLQNWNGRMSADNAAPAIFEVFYNRFLYNMLHDVIGDTLYALLQNDKIILRQTMENVWKNKGSNLINDHHKTFAGLVCTSFRETMQYLEKTSGSEPDNWKWGQIHTFTLEHPLGQVTVLDKIFQLNRGPFPVPGSFHTISPYSYRYSNLFQVVSGASQRHIYDLGNWDLSLSVIPTGNCGIPASIHYCDQTALYLAGKYHPDFFSMTKVAENFLYKAVFVPSQK